MKIQFKKDLLHQREAIDSIVDIFKGQESCKSNFTVLSPSKGQMDMYISDLGIGNRLKPGVDLLKNVREVQQRNGLPQSLSLRSNDFSVEMETGTGKTYVYLSTIFEMHEKYGFTKFIVVVPSIAIKEGTMKSLTMTKEHFKSLYDNVLYDFFNYDSQKLEQVRSFATNDYVQIMVINIDAFRKSFTDPAKETKANIIHRDNDKLSGNKPIDFIRDTQPIVIIDEPQSVDNTEKAKEAIASLNPLCTLRYSATHKEKHNLMYKLDAVDAYEKQLVKQLEVAEFQVRNYHNQAYIKLVQVDNKSALRAQVELDVMSGGKTNRTRKWVKAGTELIEVAKRDLYDGYTIDHINFEKGHEYISFSSKPEIIRLGEAVGEIDQSELKRLQIRKTIEEHLNKELILNPKGIKVLSLFFLDRVANYRLYDEEGNTANGKYAEMFEEEYKNLIRREKYRSLFKAVRDIDEEVVNVHNGYFSKDKRSKKSNQKDKFEAFADTKEKSPKNEDTFNLIMKDKERLLSFDSKLRFIFSHSALREGWDNPNVFQICTLNETQATDKKRQEIGRGLRICVNQQGERVHGFDVNTLTVMANESYEDFVKNLQKEMEEETGIRFGILTDDAFVSITTIGGDEQSVKLGLKKSQLLYDAFFNSGYIDKNGKVQDALRNDLREKKFEVPYEFADVKDQIYYILKRIAGNLNVRNAQQKKKVTLNKERFLSEEFKQLWEKVKYKTTYSVSFDENELKEKCIQSIHEQLLVSSGKIHWKKGTLEVTHAGLATAAESTMDYSISSNAHELPDIVGYLQNETHLTRKTIVDILVESKRLDAFKRNPQKFIDGVIDIIRTEMRHLIVKGIRYHKIGSNAYYRQELFEENDLYGYLTQNMIESKRSPYEYTVYDSKVEMEFALNMEKSEEVKLYAKLPTWFEIETPLGSYNPDWAVLWDTEEGDKLYFVIETKGSMSWEMLRPVEKGKIDCGKRHFKALEAGVDLEVASSFDNLREVVSGR